MSLEGVQTSNHINSQGDTTPVKHSQRGCQRPGRGAHIGSSKITDVATEHVKGGDTFPSTISSESDPKNFIPIDFEALRQQIDAISREQRTAFASAKLVNYGIMSCKSEGKKEYLVCLGSDPKEWPAELKILVEQICLEKEIHLEKLKSHLEELYPRLPVPSLYFCRTNKQIIDDHKDLLERRIQFILENPTFFYDSDSDTRLKKLSNSDYLLEETFLKDFENFNLTDQELGSIVAAEKQKGQVQNAHKQILEQWNDKKETHLRRLEQSKQEELTTIQKHSEEGDHPNTEIVREKWKSIMSALESDYDSQMSDLEIELRTQQSKIETEIDTIYRANENLETSNANCAVIISNDEERQATRLSELEEEIDKAFLENLESYSDAIEGTGQPKPPSARKEIEPIELPPMRVNPRYRNGPPPSTSTTSQQQTTPSSSSSPSYPRQRAKRRI